MKPKTVSVELYVWRSGVPGIKHARWGFVTVFRVAITFVQQL